jgi:hypothetical protein
MGEKKIVSLRKMGLVRYSLPATQYADAGTTHNRYLLPSVYMLVLSQIMKVPLQVPVPIFIRIFPITLVSKEIKCEQFT